MICVDDRCVKGEFLEGFCSMCIDNNNHRKSYHAHKNLKKFLRDLLQLCESYAEANEAEFTQDLENLENRLN